MQANQSPPAGLTVEATPRAASRPLKSSSQFAVIGAGIAGLSCATRLQQAGCAVRLFDKSRGSAGRMSTRLDEGWQWDYGAQYFTARDPAFRAEVSRWQAAGVADVWLPRLVVLGGGQHHQEAALERFVGLTRMTAPARFLADSLALTPQTTLRQLQREPDGWRLLTAERGWLDERFAAVLLALPAPQAGALLQPVAPGLAELAGSARMRCCWALMLRFAAPVPLPFDAAFVNQGPLRWVARDSSKPGRGGHEAWLLHANADWSEAQVNTAADSVAAALLQAFGQLGGPAPDTWAVHRWRYADTEPPLDAGCAWDARLGLGLCGDWINGGKVQGAWLSGQQLALQVLADRSSPFRAQGLNPKC